MIFDDIKQNWLHNACNVYFSVDLDALLLIPSVEMQIWIRINKDGDVSLLRKLPKIKTKWKFQPYQSVWWIDFKIVKNLVSMTNGGGKI